MALCFFQISDGKYSSISKVDSIVDRHAAWTEMTAVGSDLIGDAVRDLKQGGE